MFYKKYGYRLEQFLLAPRRIGIYMSKTARLIQNTVAVVCLRPEDEISIESLIEDLRNTIDYSISLEQVFNCLNHLRRAGLVTFDWRKRTVKREKPLEDYVKTYVAKEFLPKMLEDWRRISSYVQTKYGKLNSGYEKLLTML